MSKPHICREAGACQCYILALEPDENCPVHGGGEWPPRCSICGKFMRSHAELDAPESMLEMHARIISEL